jgi:hypothetical protein
MYQDPQSRKTLLIQELCIYLIYTLRRKVEVQVLYTKQLCLPTRLHRKAAGYGRRATTAGLEPNSSKTEQTKAASRIYGFLYLDHTWSGKKIPPPQSLHAVSGILTLLDIHPQCSILEHHGILGKEIFMIAIP